MLAAAPEANLGTRSGSNVRTFLWTPLESVHAIRKHANSTEKGLRGPVGSNLEAGFLKLRRFGFYCDRTAKRRM